MKILHLSTFDIEGGAAKAAYRLHQGLRKMGEDSLMLTLYKHSQDDHIISYSPLNLNQNYYHYQYIQQHYFDNQRTEISNTLFSLGYGGLDITNLKILQQCDIINLHWITSGFLSPIIIKKILDLGKPIVWTFHDMWSFTGGCHYSAGCENYQNNCLNCPQLQEDKYNLPSHLLEDKIELFNYPNLTIITPSQWLGECVKKSRVFRNHTLKIIPYGLDTDIFQPRDKIQSKKQLNLEENQIILLVGAVSGKEKRKGFLELINSLKLCKNNPTFQNLVNENKIKICCFGEENENFNQLDIETIFLGKIDSEEYLSQIYSASDIFILPSLEDNFPNTMMESMSCGTPVIAFDIGGIPDLVKNEITGLIVPNYNLYLMSENIVKLVIDNNLRHSLSNNARNVILANYKLSDQGINYVNLYHELVKRSSNFEFKKSLNNFVERGNNFDKIYRDIMIESLTKELKSKENKLEKERQIKEKIELNLRESQQRIKAMESSKFWYLRTKWLKIRSFFGLPSDE